LIKVAPRPFIFIRLMPPHRASNGGARHAMSGHVPRDSADRHSLYAPATEADDVDRIGVDNAATKNTTIS
jgi:hypothetical protein